MPIKIVLTNRGASPVIVCDVCGAWIERTDEGGYAWSESRPESGTLHEVAFVHEDRCLHAYEAEHGASTHDMPLEVLVPYLVASLEVDRTAATTMAKYYSSP
jgi:hypothetical protein